MKTLGLVAILAVLIVGLAVLFPNGCTQPNETRRVLAAQGYTEIEITGYRFFMASRDEVFSTGFKAKTQTGAVVTGAVTSGAFKGYTIRLD